MLRARRVGTTISLRPLKVDVLDEEREVGEVLDYPSSQFPVVDVYLLAVHVEQPSSAVVAGVALDVVDCGHEASGSDDGGV